jgi:monoamine oxidase
MVATVGRYVDVIVVGAGVSGLTAALELQEQGFDVLVVEAADQPGGRLANHVVSGQVLDAGGQYVGDRHVAALALAKKLGVSLHSTHAPGANLYDLRGSIRSSAQADPPAFSGLAVGDLLERLESMSRSINVADPAASPDAAALDRLTAREWADRELAHPDAHLLFGLLVGEILAVDPADVSLLHLLFYLRSGGGVSYLTAFSGGAQQERFVGGARSLVQALAERLDTRPLLSTPVREVSGDRFGWLRVTTDAESARCSRVVITAAPATADRLVVGSGRSQGGEYHFHGSTIKLHIVYDTPFWHRSGLSGWITSDQGPVKYIVDDSAGREGMGVLVGFVTGSEVEAYRTLAPAIRRSAVLDRLVRWLGPLAGHPIAYQEKDWQREPFVQGCYAGVPPLGFWTSRDLPWRPRPSDDRILWAGAERSSLFYGHIEGAVRSGQAVAHRVVQGW